MTNERAGQAPQGLHGVFSKSFVKTIIKINVTQALGLHYTVTPVQHDYLSGELKAKWIMARAT